MSNPYIQIYENQVGSGIPVFQGVRFQRGHGFFGRLFSGIGNFIKDLAPGLLRRSLPSAINLANDVIAGENVAQSAKKRLIEAGHNVAEETLDSLKSRLQKGRGICRYKKQTQNYSLGRSYRKRKPKNDW